MAACKGVNIPSGVIVLARLNCSFMMLTAGRPSLHGMCSEGMLLGFFWGGVLVSGCTCVQVYMWSPEVDTQVPSSPTSH